MMKIVLIAVTLVCLSTLSDAQEDPSMAPPAWTWIRWSDVGGNYFKVRWLPVADADSYNVYLYRGYNSDKPVADFMDIKGTTFTVGGLEIHEIYGVRVQCVGHEGHRSRLGKPARTWTFGKTTTTSTAAPTAPTPIGSCGIGSFTCETNEQCIDEQWWCDKKKDCDDGTDERNCPGHCEEITEFSPHGNFSCSRWNSPRSACFFQCNGDYRRDGPYYFLCTRGKWALPMPTCRLARPTNVNVVDAELSDVAIPILFDGLASADDYKLASLVDEDGSDIRALFAWERQGSRVKANIEGLNPDHSYKISVAYVDADSVDGLPSRPITAKTRS